MMKKKNVIIIGAAGRDFHNFNMYFRGNESYNVVAFTAAQIPDIDGRKYPKELPPTPSATTCSPPPSRPARKMLSAVWTQAERSSAKWL